MKARDILRSNLQNLLGSKTPEEWAPTPQLHWVVDVLAQNFHTDLTTYAVLGLLDDLARHVGVEPWQLLAPRLGTRWVGDDLRLPDGTVFGFVSPIGDAFSVTLHEPPSRGFLTKQGARRFLLAEFYRRVQE